MKHIIHNQEGIREFLCSIAFVGFLAAVFVCSYFFPYGNRAEDTQEQDNAIPEPESDYDSASDSVSDSEDTYIEEGTEIMKRMQNVDWENIQPRTMGDSDWRTNIICLEDIPEAGITMYGYNDEEYYGRGVAIAMEDTMYYFDWHYFSPRIVPPKLYWNQADGQLQVTLHIYTGTGVAAEELHILQKTAEGELEDSCMVPGQYSFFLAKRIGFSYEADTHTLTLYDKQEDKVLDTIILTWLEEMEEVVEENLEVENVVLGDIACFDLGNEIGLRVTPGYMVKGWATPAYDNMPELLAEIRLEESEGQITFDIGTIQRCLSDAELCKLAEKYYTAHSGSDFVPSHIAVTGDTVNGKVSIHLYEIVDDHTATYDWYEVDRVTGKGINVIFEEINLLEK